MNFNGSSFELSSFDIDVPRGQILMNSDWRFREADFRTLRADIPLPSDLARIVCMYFVKESVHHSLRSSVCRRFDGRVITWTETLSMTSKMKTPVNLSGVDFVCSNLYAFAARLFTGRVVTWGFGGCGGDSLIVEDQLVGVASIYATSRAFAALRGDGTVVTWGFRRCGGDSAKVQSELQGVKVIYCAEDAFAAERSDGTLVAWGIAKSCQKLVDKHTLNSKQETVI